MMEQASSSEIHPQAMQPAEVSSQEPGDGRHYLIANTDSSKGLGIFAERALRRGDLILSEKPLLSCSSTDIGRVGVQVNNLSNDDLCHFLVLSNAHTACACQLSVHQSIFVTNALTIGGGATSALFLTASRFNHSCAPNPRHAYDQHSGVLRVHATRAIARGEEICIAYLSSVDLYAAPRAARQARLRATYHFTCACTVCILPPSEAGRSDSRRLALAGLRVSLPRIPPGESALRLRSIVEGVSMMSAEGFVGDARELLIDAANTCAYHGDWESAVYWARVAYRAAVEEYGSNSGEAKDLEGYCVDPKSLPLAEMGPRKRFTGIRLED